MDQHRGQYPPVMRSDQIGELRRPQLVPAELLQRLSLNSGIQMQPTIPNYIQQQRDMIQMSNHLSGLPERLFYQGHPQLSMAQQQQQQHPQNHFRNYTNEPPGLSNSMLSANAAEFVPRGMQNYTPNVSQPSQSYGGPKHTIPQWEYVSHPVLQKVDTLVVDLTVKPYKYDDFSKQISSLLSRVQDPNLMKEIVSLILEQGIGEANFRYSGARLCQHLSYSINYAYEGLKFKELLLRWCQEEFECRDYYMCSNMTRVQGFTLFLGDLFTQLKTSTGQPLDTLQEAICKLLEILMMDPSNEENLKCVVKTLKVAGSLLDSTDGVLMEKVMFRLKDLTVGAPVSGDMKSMLLSTIELRASNWGMVNSSSTPSQHVDIPLGTVYYGPDGQIKKVVPDEAPESDSDDPLFGFSSSNVEELEGEEAEAFEEFLKSQHQDSY